MRNCKTLKEHMDRKPPRWHLRRFRPSICPCDYPYMERSVLHLKKAQEFIDAIKEYKDKGDTEKDEVIEGYLKFYPYELEALGVNL